MPSFAMILFALFVAALVTRNALVIRSAACLLADWALCTTLAWATGDQFNWLAMTAIDYAAGFILLWPRTSRWQVALALTYIVEITAHAAFGLAGRTPWSVYDYWWALSYISWGQLWLVGGWIAHDGIKNRLGRAALPCRLLARGAGHYSSDVTKCR